jgi:hypothetical protein
MTFRLSMLQRPILTCRMWLFVINNLWLRLCLFTRTRSHRRDVFNTMSARQFLPSLWVIKPDILNPVRDLDIDPFLFQSHMYSLGDLLRRYPQCSRVVFKLDRWDVFIGWGLDF